MSADDWDSQPNCGHCGDTGHIGPRRCPACNPGLARIHYEIWRWRIWGWLARAMPHSRIAAAYNRPPPF